MDSETAVTEPMKLYGQAVPDLKLEWKTRGRSAAK